MDRSQPTIFVSIASYGDPVLPFTLDCCLANARYPENLRFGLCWQCDESTAVDLSRFKADRRFHVSEHHCRDSEGGSWARSIAQEFWDGETYTLQIDSHRIRAALGRKARSHDAHNACRKTTHYHDRAAVLVR
jgi:hypothetical protein